MMRVVVNDRVGNGGACSHCGVTVDEGCGDSRRCGVVILLMKMVGTGRGT